MYGYGIISNNITKNENKKHNTTTEKHKHRINI